MVLWTVVTDTQHRVSLNARTGKLWTLVDTGRTRQKNGNIGRTGNTVFSNPSSILLHAVILGTRFDLESDAELGGIRHTPFRGDRLPGDRGGYYGVTFRKVVDGYQVVDLFKGISLTFDEQDGHLLSLRADWEYEMPRDRATVRITREQAIRIAGPIDAAKASVNLGWARLNRSSSRARIVYCVLFNETGWSGTPIYVDAETGVKGNR